MLVPESSISVEFLGQTLSAESVPARLSDHTVVMVAADTLLAEDLKPLLAAIQVRYTRAKDKGRFFVVLLSGATPAPYGPYRSWAALEKELREALRRPESSDETAPINAVRLYDALASTLPEELEEYSVLVWAGRFPELDPSLCDYATARTGRLLAERRLLLDMWTPEGSRPEWLDTLIYPVPKPPLMEASWKLTRDSEGFTLGRAVIRDGSEGLATRVELAVSAGFRLPSLEAYAALRSATAAVTAKPEDPALLAGLIAARPANPGDDVALRAGAEAAFRQKDTSASVLLLAPMVVLMPKDATLAQRYAHALYDRGPQIEAEPAIVRAIELNPADALLHERAGRIRLTRGDRRGALGRLAESTRLRPDNEALWWIQADVAKEIQEPKREAAALARALQLNPSPFDRRARLLRLTIDAGDTAGARTVLDPFWKQLPAEAPVLAEYAAFWEELKDPAPALALWQRATQVDATFEPGYHASARLLLAEGKTAEALAAAEAGLKPAPDSARLHIARAGALHALGRWQEARRALAQPAGRLKDPALLRRHAEMEDLFGKSAPLAWQRYVESLGSAKSAASQAVRDRGLTVALRDDELERVDFFLGKVKNPKDEPAWVPPPLTNDNCAVVPGGLEALSYVAGTKRSGGRSGFFRDYARTISQHAEVNDPKVWEAYRDSILEHFAKVAKLKTWGRTTGLKTVIPLSVTDKASRQRSQAVLEFLGYKLRVSGAKTTLDAGEKKNQGRKQGILAALGIDEIAMKEALEAGKGYQIEVVDELAEVLFTDALWQREFYARIGGTGGMAGFLASQPAAARVYAGLSGAGPEMASQITKSVSIRILIDRYADLLFMYGPAIASDRGRLLLPGGPEAEPAWKALAGGVSPGNPGAFLQTLISAQEGRLLAWFASLGELTPDRQRFMTMDAGRCRRFYELFKDAPEFKMGVARRVRQSPLLEFLKEIPLDSDLSVRFPGGPEVWQVARGQSSIEKSGKLLRKAQKATPMQEDEILVRLAKERYSAGASRVSQMENFLAVARIDARRQEPLSPAEAMLLTQKFARFSGVYGYFGSLTTINEAQLTAFFRMAERWKDIKDVDENTVLGHFHSMVRLITLFAETGALSQDKAASIFASLCERLEKSELHAGWTRAMAATIADLMAAAPGHKSFLELTEAALLGPEETIALAGGVPEAAMRPGAMRRREFRQVLEMQKIPPVDLLLRLTALTQSCGKGAAATMAALPELEKGFALIPALAIEKKVRLKGEQRESLELFTPRKAPGLLRELRQKAAKKKPNPKDLESIATELLAELSPPLQLTLTGLVYAWYLRPSDLLVSEDPWLVRKHMFFELDSPAKLETKFPGGDFLATSEGLGSIGKGSLANFSSTAGMIAISGRKSAGRFGENLESAQMGTLRATPFWMLREPELRLLHLRMLAGREYLVEAGRRPEVMLRLAGALGGRLSPQRRTRVLTALQAPDWPVVWENVSLSELYWLGSECTTGLKAEPWPSPLFAALREVEARADLGRLRWIGQSLAGSTGTDVPVLLPLPPYEDYAGQLMPVKLAERLAEFKLYLARLADQEGLPASALDVISETLFQRAMQGLQMTDMKDWASVLQAFSTIKPAWLAEIPATVGGTR
jgi:tetratricopeptide (TPR) repeat protein